MNESFIELIDNCNLEQIVDFPTRKSNILDLVLTNRPSYINRCIPVPGFGDHDTGILTDMICHQQLMKPVKRRVYNWNKANMEKLK